MINPRESTSSLRKRLTDTARATGGTALGSVFGAILPFAIAAWFPDKAITDAYFLAFGGILFAIGLVAVVLEGIVVSFAVEARSHGALTLREFARRSAIQGALVALVCSAAIVLAFQIVVLPHTGLSTDVQKQAMRFLWPLSLLPMFAAAASILAGSLYSLNRYFLPTTSQGLRAGSALVAAVLLRSQLGMHSVVVGLLFGEALRLVLLASALARSTKMLPVESSGPPHRIEGLWRTMLPQTVSMSIVGLGPIIDRLVSARIGIGSVTLLELAEKLFYMPLFLMVTGVGLVSNVTWSQLGRRGAWLALRRDYYVSQTIVAALGTFAAVGAAATVFLFRSPLSAAVAIGSPSDLVATFTLYALGLPFALSSHLSVRLLVAHRHTRVLVVMATVGLVVNLVADLAFAALWGVPGIALASSLVRIGSAVLASLFVRSLLRQVSCPEHGGVPCAASPY